MELQAFFSERKERFVSDLSRLVKIDSVRAPALPGMPFGEGGARALGEAAAILGEHGYTSVNYDNYALEADLGPAPSLMLLAHLDVVPVGDGWTRPPFSLTVEGDLAYGRGTTDDKGAAVACLYAMDACRALYGEPKTGVRLVLGSGEETGSEDMEHYFAKRPMLESTLSPDADYPLINIEKGRFAPTFVKSVLNEGERRVLEIVGGQTQNIVPGKANALVAGVPANAVQAAAAAVQAETGVRFTVSEEPAGCRIFAVGASAHAAQPEKGNNAQTALISLLCALPLSENDGLQTLRALMRLFPHGETDGAHAGVQMADASSGALTLNFGVLQFINGTFTCGADLRTPVRADGAGIEALFGAAVASAGFTCVGEPKHKKSHCVPENSRLVQTCLRAYEKHTGRKGACLAIGGGTYVHDIPGGVAFGIEFPGRDYRIHGADEFADINELLLTAQIYADVIRELCYENA